MFVVQTGFRGTPGCTPLLIPDGIQDGLPEVRLQRAVTAWFEAVQVANRANHRVLHEIRGVDATPSPPGQLAARPPAQIGQLSRKEGTDRAPAPCLRPTQQGERRRS